ncbi:MAG TPA: hypothetical protein VJ843_00170 [Candidatus Saccharimonadales bacterium]|nr:hypothetical protein [Candidatus Saccharimonadales bacterium]
MQIPKKYLHDKPILSLVSVTIFLAFACAVLVLLRLDSSSGSGYIVQYHANLGISAFKTGSASVIVSFAVFALVFAAINVVLSVYIYSIRRQLAGTFLCLGILVLILAIIVSNALLVLR